MEMEFDQASQSLDKAIISYSAGDLEDGCKHLQEAAAILQAMLSVRDAPPLTAEQSVVMPVLVETKVPLETEAVAA